MHYANSIRADMANREFETGDIILIKLASGRGIEAEFVRKTPEEIVVKWTKNLRTGKVRENIQTFFLSEINAIHPIRVNATVNSDEGQSVQSSNINNASQNENTENNSIIRQSIQKKASTEREIATIQTLAKNTIHIAQFDDNYHNAVSDLRNQEIVFVNYESMFGRLDTKSSVLTIATLSKVYLFDMLRLGAMKKELKKLFSSELPRKVIHSTVEFADYLQHKETCTLNGAFDTLMVHFNLKKTREHITLQKCLKNYFDLPDDFVLQKQNFNIRPLPSEALIRATLTSIMLMKLYWHMNDILMKPLQIATANFAEVYQRVENQVDLMMHVNAGAHPGVEIIELDAVEQLEEALDQSVNLIDL